MACLDTSFLIAAIAIVAGEALVTSSPSHFQNNPGLTVQVY